MPNMDFDMNKLVSNIVHMKQYSHCRLCLAEIKNENQFIKFEDSISIDEENINFQSLQEIIDTLFVEDKLTRNIRGVDAVCVPCVNKAIQCFRFIKTCQTSTDTLHRVLDNIVTALNDTEALDIDNIEKNEGLYLTVCDTNYKCALIIKDKEKLKQKKPEIQSQCMCLICGKDFGSVISLKAHNATYHFTSTCMACYETFIDESELGDHIRNNHHFQCSLCQVIKSSEENLQEHMHRAHDDIVCKICKKSLKGLDNLKRHLKTHPEDGKCPKCGKKYTHLTHYKNHVRSCVGEQTDSHRTRSSIVKTFVCVKCGKSYTTENALGVHMRFLHGNAKTYECEHCRKKFNTPSLLKKHLLQHREK